MKCQDKPCDEFKRIHNEYNDFIRQALEVFQKIRATNDIVGFQAVLRVLCKCVESTHEALDAEDVKVLH